MSPTSNDEAPVEPDLGHLAVAAEHLRQLLPVELRRSPPAAPGRAARPPTPTPCLRSAGREVDAELDPALPARRRKIRQHVALAAAPGGVADAVVRGLRLPPAEAAVVLGDEHDVPGAHRFRSPDPLIGIELRRVHGGRFHRHPVALGVLPRLRPHVDEHAELEVVPGDLLGRGTRGRVCGLSGRLGCRAVRGGAWRAPGCDHRNQHACEYRRAESHRSSGARDWPARRPAPRTHLSTAACHCLIASIG